jgi:tetratricopeptide (TPR) repeat protein
VQDIQRDLEKVAPGSYPEAHADLGQAYAGMGEAASAIAEGQKAMAIHPTSKDPFEGPRIEEYMARIYALLGDHQHALDWLKRAVALGDVNYPWFEQDKNYASLRSDPEYQSIMAGVRQRWEEYKKEFDSTP